MNHTVDKMKQMYLSGMSQIHHQRIAENLHTDYSVDEYVDLLVDQEWDLRQTRKINRLIAHAKFRIQAMVTEIDYMSKRNLDRDLFKRLITLNFIKNTENILLTGPAGVGKSYLAQALGRHACSQGVKTLYGQTARLLAELKYAKLDGSYLRRLTRIAKCPILILDDFGLHHLDQNEREILMDLIDDRNNIASTIIASQLPVDKWHAIIGEGTIADAILDRIIHAAHRVALSGESLRKTKIK